MFFKLNTRLPLVLIAIFLWMPAKSQNKKICITVDDLPSITYGLNSPSFNLELTQNLIKAFKKHQVPAIGYVNTQKLYNKNKLVDSKVNLLELWLKNGLELGNHTFSHQDFHRVDFDTYTEDILNGEKIVKPLVEQYNGTFQYFRHPYLRTGLRASQADSLKVFLKQNGYITAPVTIDNDDYLFALAFQKAFQKGDDTQMNRIGKDYLKYMEQKLLFFENQSHKLFNRNINQILLLHANYLNAQYLDDLLSLYTSHGYTFVSQTEALQDPAYLEPITKFGNWGISWLDRWALSRGKKGDFFKGDPVTPAYIKELTK